MEDMELTRVVKEYKEGKTPGDGWEIHTEGKEVIVRIQGKVLLRGGSIDHIIAQAKIVDASYCFFKRLGVIS